MKPRLSVVTGPLRGQVLELGGSVSVGRDPGNALRIKQLSVSKCHCLIEREDDRFKVVDRSSFGTFVNHVPVKERYLEHGDEITIGESLLVFLLHEEVKDPGPTTTQLDQAGGVTVSALRLRREDIFSPKAGAGARTLRHPAGLVRALNSLLNLSSVIRNDRELGALYEHLLDSVMEAIPAERGAILHAEKGASEYAVLADRGRAGAGPLHVCSRSVEQVARDGVAILSDESSGGPRSYTLLCAPLRRGGDAAEVVYLISESGGQLAERHLELLAGIAVVAAVAVENVAHVERLKDENRRLRSEALVAQDMIGEGPAMREVNRLIEKVAPKDSTVLIRGESGTGKELAAYAIHAKSPRAAGPFVAVNCAALSEPLLESELFGHEKGAFTGAVAQKKGKLELAGGGTFFLDEVGETSPAIQAKLLRVLQKRVIERVGGNRPIKVDVRLLAATNKDLEAAIGGGTFREDLYYRLNVIELVMPPLRERREDIPLLAIYFAKKHGWLCKRRVLGVSPEAQELLARHEWRGNVRELENVIERAVVLGATELILAEDLPPNLLKPGGPAGKGRPLTFKAAVREYKERLVREALGEAGGSYPAAAKLLGMHPNNLHRLARTLKIKIGPEH